jgi:hypothetical protein
MAAQNAGLPHEEEEQHEANPADEVPTKSTTYHPSDDGDGGRQKTGQEVQQVTPVEAAVGAFRFSWLTLGLVWCIMPVWTIKHRKRRKQ